MERGGSLVWGESLATMQTLGHNVTGQHIVELIFFASWISFCLTISSFSIFAKRVESDILTGFNGGIQANGMCERAEERVSDRGEMVLRHCKVKQGPPVRKCHIR